MLSHSPRLRRTLLASIGAGILSLSPLHHAKAYGFVGFGFGFPFFAPFYPFYGPPVVFAPAPVVYASPPVVYTQPPPYNAAPSARCYAGAYVCPLRQPVTVGSPCSCPTDHTRAAGRVG